MRRERRLRNLAIINILVVAAAVAGVAYFVTQVKPQAYDPDTLCLLEGPPPPHTAVVIDKTDEYDAEQAGRIAALVRRAKDALAVGERITVFELDARGQFDPRGDFALCNPGRGAQVNPLYQNPRFVEERYKELFEGPLEAALADLVEPKEAPASPIVEALARLAQTEAFGKDVAGRRILLVSDMLQNSDIFSVYGGRGALPAAMPAAADAAEAVRKRFGEALSGTSLEVRLIPREGFEDLQRGPLKAFYDAYFRELGVSLSWRDL